MTASRSTSSAFLYINNGLIALLIKLNTYSTKYYCSLTVTIAVYTAQMFSARFLETRQYSGGALKHTENNSQICWSKVEWAKQEYCEGKNAQHDVTAKTWLLLLKCVYYKLYPFTNILTVASFVMLRRL